MYVTIHRLRSPDGVPGFNSFIYFHGNQNIPDEFDDDAEAELLEGEPAAALLQHSPGGNFVDSYLDVVGPDEAIDDVAEALLDASWRISGAASDKKEMKKTFRVGKFRFRFYSSSRIPGSAATEFTTLCSFFPALRERIGEPTHPPLIIVRRRLHQGFEYSLSDDTAEHIRAKGMEVPNTRLTIDDDVYDAFEKLRGHIVETEVASLIVMPSSPVTSLFDGSCVVGEDGTLLHQTHPGAKSGNDVEPRVR